MSKMIRLLLLLLVFVPCAWLLSGCWDRTEVNDLAIITMAGLDLTDDNEIELSAKVQLTSLPFSQQSQGSSESGGASINGAAIIRTARGTTLAEALSELQLVISRRVFWGHTEVIVFGQKLAEQGIGGPVELILRHPEARERAKIFVSRGSAKDILELNPTVEHSIADKLREMARLQTGLHITFKEMVQMLISQSQTAVLPYLNIEPAQKQQEAFPYIQGTAVFKGEKMVGTIDEQTTRGVMWARDELDQGTVTVTPKGEEGFVSFQLLRSHTETIPFIDGERWGMKLRISTLDDILENTTQLDLSIPTHIDAMERELEEDIKRRVSTAIHQAQEELNADIFQFADCFYRKYPKVWEENKSRWSEIFPNLEIEYEAEAKITRPGMTGKSILIPTQE